jgi:hypothetical protein
VETWIKPSSVQLILGYKQLFWLLLTLLLLKILRQFHWTWPRPLETLFQLICSWNKFTMLHWCFLPSAPNKRFWSFVLPNFTLLEASICDGRTHVWSTHSIPRLHLLGFYSTSSCYKVTFLSIYMHSWESCFMICLRKIYLMTQTKILPSNLPDQSIMM